MNTQPDHYPRCVTCKESYVYRRCMVFGAPSGVKWLWQADCRTKTCRKSGAELISSETGEVVAS